MRKKWRQLDLPDLLNPQFEIFLSKFIPVLSVFFFYSLLFDIGLLKCMLPLTFHEIVLACVLLIMLSVWLVRWGWYTVTYRYIVYFSTRIISLTHRVLANRFVQFFILFGRASGDPKIIH